LQVLARDQLDRDALPQRNVHRAVHGAHRALADLLFEAVLTADDEARLDAAWKPLR